MAATARLIVLMEEAEKASLEAQAAAARVSTAELVRRRLFGREEPPEAAFRQVLAELGPFMRRACRTIDANLEAVRAMRERAAEEDARAARRALADLTADELGAVGRRLAPASSAAPERRRKGRS